MKNTLLLAFSLSALAVSAQQHVFDFEDLKLSDSTFFNGVSIHPADSINNSFSFGDELVQFHGSTSLSWGSVNGTGIGYSNQTNQDTAGYTNSGSAYNDDATNPSTTFGVINGNGSFITFSEPVRLTSIDITNTVYAYLSMQKGDSFAKKFGGKDGTDPDFFKVSIIAFDIDSNQIDSAAFALADYTADKSEDDYALSTWKTFSLTSFKDSVTTLKFYFSSSDNGIYGMNTPAYVAIDNLTFSQYEILPDDEPTPTSARCLCAKDGVVSLENAVSISLYSLNGVLVAQGIDAVSAQGMFIAIGVTADGEVIREQILLD